MSEGRPSGPYAGGKWKKALCFRSHERFLHIFILDVNKCRENIWLSKYQIRQEMAELSGNPGNSCIHITDDQSEILAKTANTKENQIKYYGGCNDSYAFSCARCLLNPISVRFLNCDEIDDIELGSEKFNAVWERYCKWLIDLNYQDGISDSDKIDKFKNEPLSLFFTI